MSEYLATYPVILSKAGNTVTAKIGNSTHVQRVGEITDETYKEYMENAAEPSKFKIPNELPKTKTTPEEQIDEVRKLSMKWIRTLPESESKSKLMAFINTQLPVKEQSFHRQSPSLATPQPVSVFATDLGPMYSGNPN